MGDVKNVEEKVSIDYESAWYNLKSDYANLESKYNIAIKAIKELSKLLQNYR